MANFNCPPGKFSKDRIFTAPARFRAISAATAAHLSLICLRFVTEPLESNPYRQLIIRDINAAIYLHNDYNDYIKKQFNK